LSHIPILIVMRLRHPWGCRGADVAKQGAKILAALQRQVCKAPRRVCGTRSRSSICQVDVEHHRRPYWKMSYCLRPTRALTACFCCAVASSQWPMPSHKARHHPRKAKASGQANDECTVSIFRTSTGLQTVSLLKALCKWQSSKRAKLLISSEGGGDC
jgi:hypothetical protein